MKVAEAAFAKWARQRTAALAQDQKLTIGQIMDIYIEDREIEGKRADKMRHQWKALKPMFEKLQPADATTKILVNGKKRTRCHTYAFERETLGRARDTIHSELALLRTALRWAVTNGHIDKAPPIWVPPAGSGRDTALTEDEMKRLLAAMWNAPFHTRLFLILAMSTAARAEAILELSWQKHHVNFETGVIDFRRKGERSILDTSHIKNRAVIDMTPILREVLLDAHEWRTPKVDRVIEWNKKPVARVTKSVKAVFRAAGIERKYMGAHALRHTLATWAAAHGIDPSFIQRLLGHKDLSTTIETYIEHKAGSLLEAASVIGEVLQLTSESGELLETKTSREDYERSRRSLAQKRRNIISS